MTNADYADMTTQVARSTPVKPARELPAHYHGKDPRKRRPFWAMFLSLFPGLGQIYIGYYQRGFTFIVIACSLLSLLTMGSYALYPAVLSLFLFFCLFCIIDAGRLAMLYNLTLDGIEEIELPSNTGKFTMGGSQPIGAVVIVASLIGLSHTLFDMPLDWLQRWWPVAPLLLGAYLVYAARVERKGGASTD